MEKQKDVKIVLGSYDAIPHPYHHQFLGDVSTWIISDINPRTPSIERIDAMDIPYKDVSALYASHILEHLSEPEKALKHWHAVLKKDGWVHINVPNVEFGLDMLMKVNRGEPLDNHYFRDRERVMSIINGTMESEFDTHKSWFTPTKLAKMVEDAGFSTYKIWTEFEAHDMECILVKAIK